MKSKLKPPLYLLVLSMTLFFQSCYNYHITTSHFDPSTNYQRKNVNAFFWGLVQKNVVAGNCDSLHVNSLDEVHVKTNFGYAVITVVTLGIWCPMTIEWKCAKPCAREGNIP